MGAPQNRFGPFYLGSTLGTRNGCELSLATYFGPEGSPRPVALRQTRECHDGVNERFLSCAEKYAIVRHDNVVPVRDLGTLGGRTYVATDFIEGKNLLHVLSKCGRARMGFPTDVALYIVTRILDALDHAHGLMGPDGPLEITHGDICHSNVLVTGRGEVMLTDFQMACGSTRRRTRRGINRGGGLGYSTYLAPEQLQEQPFADERSDVFSLGVVLYELVTGHLLFNAATEATILKRLRADRIEVPLEKHRPDLHPHLSQIVMKSLAPNPDDRFQTAAAFKADIEHLVASVGATLKPLFLANFMERLFGKEIAELKGVA